MKTGDFSKFDYSVALENQSSSIILLQAKNVSNEKKEKKFQKGQLNSSLEVTSKTNREDFLEAMKSNRSFDFGKKVDSSN